MTQISGRIYLIMAEKALISVYKSQLDDHNAAPHEMNEITASGSFHRLGTETKSQPTQHFVGKAPKDRGL